MTWYESILFWLTAPFRLLRADFQLERAKHTGLRYWRSHIQSSKWPYQEYCRGSIYSGECPWKECPKEAGKNCPLHSVYSIYGPDQEGEKWVEESVHKDAQ